MGQLVDQYDGGFAGLRRIEIELLERDAFMGDIHHRDDRKSAKQLFRFRPAVGFNYTGNHIDAVFQLCLRSGKHGIGLPRARAAAEKNFQSSTVGLCFFLLNQP